MSHWAEALSFRPYNIKTGTVTITGDIKDNTNCVVTGLQYLSSNYTVSITPKFRAYMVPYVTDVTTSSFRINGSPGEYYWTTISTS